MLLQPEVRSQGGIGEDRDSLEISQQDVEAYLVERQVPTREDLDKLYSQLEELSRKLEEVNKPDDG